MQPGKTPEHGVLPEFQPFHDKLISSAETNTKEHRTSTSAASVSGNEHLGAGRALWEWQNVMFFDGQAVAQRDHHEDPEDSAGSPQQKNEESTGIEPQENQRRHGKDYSSSERFSCGSDRVGDIVFQDRSAPQNPFQYSHRDHCRRD